VLDYTLFPLKNPERLVLDLGGEDAGGVLASLQEKVAAGDPYIAALRVAANRPGEIGRPWCRAGVAAAV